MSKAKDLTGQRFGRLVVTEMRIRPGQKSHMCAAKCDCGMEVVVRCASLTHMKTKSCGCLNREFLNKRAEKLKIASEEMRRFHGRSR